MYDPVANAAALRAEVVGFQAHYGDPGSTRAVLAKLNTKTADTAICRVPANSAARTISGSDLMEATLLDGAEFAVAVNPANPAHENRRMVLRAMFDLHDASIPLRFQDELISVTGMFNVTDAPTIRAAIIAEATGPQSMAESMFGDDSTIGSSDLSAALGPPDAPTLMDAAQQQQYIDDYMDHYTGDDKVAERARITALAPTKEAPGQTATWS